LVRSVVDVQMFRTPNVSAAPPKQLLSLDTLVLGILTYIAGTTSIFVPPPPPPPPPSASASASGGAGAGAGAGGAAATAVAALSVELGSVVNALAAHSLLLVGEMVDELACLLKVRAE
jgi:hypothetical protein